MSRRRSVNRSSNRKKSIPDYGSAAPGAPPGLDAFRSWKRWSFAGDGKTRVRLDLLAETGKTAVFEVETLRPSVMKISMRPAGARPSLPTGMMIPSAGSPHPLSVRETKDRIHISGPRTGLVIRKNPFRLTITDGRGRMILEDGTEDIDGLGRPLAFPFGIADGIAGGRGRVFTASFHIRPGERFFGLGEKFTRLDKSGQVIVSWTRDALGSTTESSHKNIPYLWSTRGYGLFVDSGARITWDVGSSSIRSLNIAVEDDRLDLFVIHGRTPVDLLHGYTELTGRPPVTPPWSFGLWISSGGTYRTQAEVEALIEGFKRRRVPASVVHIDPWWMRWRTYCDFRWDPETFPDPEGLIRRIHGLGMRLCLWEHPYISVESDLFAFGRKRGFFVRRPDGRPYVFDYGLSLAPRPDGNVRLSERRESWNAPVAAVDLTHPGALAWFKDLHRPLLRQGVDVFKTDFGEDIPEDAVFHDGRTGAVMHNLYPLLYNQTVAEVTKDERGYALVWSRAGTAGSQRYPVAWSGDPAADWDSLAATIRGGLSAGMSGLAFWSHDIGGFRGMPSAELYVRWAQFGLLCSHSRMHGDGPREPWIFGGRALEAVRKAVRLRLRLLPYIRSLAHEASRTGLPVIRSLPLAFPDDPNVHGWEDEFMLGPWLLVAPLVEPGGKRRVYLPELRRSEGPRLFGGNTANFRKLGSAPIGTHDDPEDGEGFWMDFRTGKKYPPGRVIDVRAPLDRIPLFVRSGAILPVAQIRGNAPRCPVDPLVLEIWPGLPSAFRFFEDEGRTDFYLEKAGRNKNLLARGDRASQDVKILWRPDPRN
ncbi:MAG: glycoside hydrolase family 31 protein [Acidobacteriota bacterium]|nr:glycoside hydrolase family 31 protein [Acidobacteriota bacterium]